MLRSLRDSHRICLREVSCLLNRQQTCLSIQRNSLRGASSEWSGSTEENSPQQRQLQLRSSGSTPRRATRSTCLVPWVDQAAAPVGVRPEVPAVVHLADSRSAWASVVQAAAVRAGHPAVARAGHPEAVQADRLEVPRGVHPADSLIEHRLDTGLRTEHPSRQYRALFQFLHGQLHRPLRRDRLIRFQSGLVHQALFR
jgi:hypothetical protein